MAVDVIKRSEILDMVVLDIPDTAGRKIIKRRTQATQLARIHTSFLINIENIFNRAELRLTKTRPTSFYKKHNLL